MGYLASALPLLPPNVRVYLDTHTRGGVNEFAGDVVQLAEVLATLGGRRLIYTSSAVLYDPMISASEEDYMPKAPRTCYMLTKQTQEAMIRLAGVDAVVLRLGSIMGVAPTMRWDLLPNRFVWTAVTDGRIPLTMPKAWRPILGIGDAVRAVEWAVTAPAGIYNITSVNMRVSALADLVATRCGAVVEHPGEAPYVPTFSMSCVRALRAGWQPCDRIEDLIDGLRERAAC